MRSSPLQAIPLPKTVAAATALRKNHPHMSRLGGLLGGHREEFGRVGLADSESSRRASMRDSSRTRAS